MLDFHVFSPVGTMTFIEIRCPKKASLVGMTRAVPTGLAEFFSTQCYKRGRPYGTDNHFQNLQKLPLKF